MSKNDPIEVRIEKMAEWAKGVNETLDDLVAAMTVSIEEHADSIALQLADLLSRRESGKADYLAALEVKAQLGIDSDLDDRIAAIEAETMLDVSCKLDANGKVLYSNAETRKAAITIALDANEAYRSLINQKRTQQRDLAQARAVLEALDREASDYKRATENLTARLNNLTARVGVRRNK